MIKAVIVGKEGVIESFRALPAKASDRLREVLKDLAFKMLTKVKNEKLSGQVLKNRTGTLRRSINSRIEESGTKMTALVGTNVVYAAIHEYGGIIKIAPRSQKLYYKMKADGTLGNRWVRKSHSNFMQEAERKGHEIHMPERSFLRSALTEMEGQIRSELGTAMKGLGKP